jgi:hypothetical protein
MLRNISLIIFAALLLMTASVTMAENHFPVMMESKPNAELPESLPEHPQDRELWEWLTWRKVGVNSYDFLPPDKRREKTIKKYAENRKELKEKARQAHQKGAKVVLHDYEINHSGTTGVRLDTRQKRSKFLEQKLYEIMKLCPWLDGYAMTLTESPNPAQAVEDFHANILGAWRGIKKANEEDGKERVLVVRSWLSDERVEDIVNYFPVPLEDPEDKENIYFVTKHQHQDFHMKQPINPLLGKVGDHPQIAAFDVTVCEYRALGWYPCGIAHEWSERFRQLAQIPSLDGLMPHHNLGLKEYQEQIGHFKDRNTIRVWRDGKVVWSPWNHLNAYIFYRLANNPFEDPNEIYNDWITENYGKEAVEPLREILIKSHDVVYEAYGPNHSAYSPRKSRYFYAPIETLLPTKSDVSDEIQVSKQFAPVTMEWIQKRRSKLNQALKTADKMITTLENNKTKFDQEDYRRIHKDLVGLKNYTEVKKICEMGALRSEYTHANNLSGENEERQLQIIDKLVQRGEWIYNNADNFLFRRGQSGIFSYIHTVRWLRKFVNYRRTGDYYLPDNWKYIFTEKVLRQQFGDTCSDIQERLFGERSSKDIGLEFRPDGITTIDDKLYILSADTIYETKLKDEKFTPVCKLKFDGKAITDDGAGNLLICGKDSIYRIKGPDSPNNPVEEWCKLPDYIESPDAVAYDNDNNYLFIGDNKPGYHNEYIYMIDATDKTSLTRIKVPAHHEARPHLSKEKKVRGLSFYNDCLYAVESYSKAPFQHGNRWVYKLRKYSIEKDSGQITESDVWHIDMGRSPRRLGYIEDVCFDSNGNAWMISPDKPAQMIDEDVPHEHSLYKVKLQK